MDKTHRSHETLAKIMMGIKAVSEVLVCVCVCVLKPGPEPGFVGYPKNGTTVFLLGSLYHQKLTS